jgi:hypothetical protein
MQGAFSPKKISDLEDFEFWPQAIVIRAKLG